MYRDVTLSIFFVFLDFSHPNEITSMFILLGLKSLMFFVTVTSPIPAGIFAPLMLMGSILGRMYGHILKTLLG